MVERTRLYHKHPVPSSLTNGRRLYLLSSVMPAAPYHVALPTLGTKQAGEVGDAGFDVKLALTSVHINGYKPALGKSVDRNVAFGDHDEPRVTTRVLFLVTRESDDVGSGNLLHRQQVRQVVEGRKDRVHIIQSAGAGSVAIEGQVGAEEDFGWFVFWFGGQPRQRRAGSKLLINLGVGHGRSDRCAAG